VGPDKIPAIRDATKTLLDQGHRRIVLLTRRAQRLPEPSAFVRAFLDELAAQNVSPGSYHLPDWGESVKGLDSRLDSLFRVTPPTAMIIEEPPLFVATRHFLGRRGLLVPEDVSLVCNDDDPAFGWCTPPVSHIRWDRSVVVRRVAQWVSNVSRGKEDLRQTSTPAVFIRGGTIGPVKGK
jgi:DNA-binding LacI/PurR family transcriptional regulator